MAETHCEVCDERFAWGARKVLVAVAGGYGYAHEGCAAGRAQRAVLERAKQADSIAYDVPRGLGKSF